MSGLVGVAYLPIAPTAQPVNNVGGSNQPMPNVMLVPRYPRRDASIDAEFVAGSIAITRTIKQITATDPITKAWLTVKNIIGDADPGLLQKIITKVTALASPGQITDDGSGTAFATSVAGVGKLQFTLVIADTQAFQPNIARPYDIQVLTQAGLLYTVEAGGFPGGAGGGFTFLPRVTVAVS